MSNTEELSVDDFEWDGLSFLAEEFYEGFIDKFFEEQFSGLFEDLTSQDRSHFLASFLGCMEENVCNEKATLVSLFKRAGMLPEDYLSCEPLLHRDMCKISMAEFFARSVDGKIDDQELTPEILNVIQYVDDDLQDELKIVAPTFAKLLDPYIR